MMRALCLVLLCSSCLYSRAAEVPMPMTMHASGDAPKGVFVFLPGLGDEPEKFVENGFVDRVKALGFDAATVDAHFGYYRDRILKPRLDADVIAPLRAKGYSKIWLCGISLGGFGSVLYSVEHADVAGLIVLAPFLGDEDTWGPIEKAGGLGAWQPPDLNTIGDTDERALVEMWIWLRGYASGEPRPPLYLGFGDEDRFIRPEKLLSGALGEDHVAVVPGGHKWTVWKIAFEQLVGRVTQP
jgi:pimeloyl-ACP methyl ester carboxylesterase